MQRNKKKEMTLYVARFDSVSRLAWNFFSDSLFTLQPISFDVWLLQYLKPETRASISPETLTPSVLYALEEINDPLTTSRLIQYAKEKNDNYLQRILEPLLKNKN